MRAFMCVCLYAFMCLVGLDDGGKMDEFVWMHLCFKTCSSLHIECM